MIFLFGLIFAILSWNVYKCCVWTCLKVPCGHLDELKAFRSRNLRYWEFPPHTPLALFAISMTTCPDM